MVQSREFVSKRMSRIRGSGSLIERKMASELRKAKISYRRNVKVFGKPDFILSRYRIAIFCDSNFWHGYQWGEAPCFNFKSNKEFWRKKIERNKARDAEVNRELSLKGWTVVRFWEHDILKSPNECIVKLRRIISATQS